MIEQQTCEHVESPAPHLGETWVTLADLSQMIGIHPDTIRSAVRKVRERQEPWVKKAPDAHRRIGGDVWWINTESSGYKELLVQWRTRANRLRTNRNVIPLTRRASSRRGETLAGALQPGEGVDGQLLTAYLVSQGLEIYVNALSPKQERSWNWRWADLHGEHFGSLEEALIAALHSRMGGELTSSPTAKTGGFLTLP